MYKYNIASSSKSIHKYNIANFIKLHHKFYEKTYTTIGGFL